MRRDFAEFLLCESINFGLEINFCQGLQTHLNLNRDSTGRRERISKRMFRGKMHSEIG